MASNRYGFNANKVTKDCINWIKNFFDKNGKDCKAVVGISGGKDSTIVAALCKEALGAERVLGVLMPNGEQKDYQDSLDVCASLGIPFRVVNIETIYNSFTEEVQNLISPLSEQTTINLSPRIRMVTLYAISQTIKGRVANTSNFSEEWIGWSTRWGDSVGDFAPLLYLTATEVKAIGKELGIEDRFIKKVPADGLCGKTDEESFGFTYEALDKYLRTGKVSDNVKEKVDAMHAKNKFKMEPISSFRISL